MSAPAQIGKLATRWPDTVWPDRYRPPAVGCRQAREIDVKDRLFEALKRSRADYAEIRFESNDSTGIAYRGREIESVSTGKFSGVKPKASIFCREPIALYPF